MNTNTPLVSVIVPTHNRPYLLRRAIRSILSQTYNNLEIIVVDDCPSNPVGHVIKSISDSRIRYVLHSSNKGVCGARNTGIDESNGEYISFLDDDDEWKTNKIQKQVDLLKTSPEIGLVYTGTRAVDDSNNTLSVNKPTIGGDVTKQLLLGDFVPFSTVLVDQNIVEKAGPLDEHLTNWEDWEWCIRLSLHTNFGFVKHPLVILHRGSHEMRSDDFEKKQKTGYKRFVEKAMPHAQNYGQIFEKKAKAHINYRLGYSALSNGYYTDARRQLFTSIKIWPFSTKFYTYFILSILGGQGYKTAQSMKRWYVDKLY
jgi:glycosyltransferase involved in cell wall biosynthesis